MSTLGQLVEGYLAGPRDIRAAIAGKWSTYEVVCHLADSEQAWAHRIKRVIAEDKPLLIGYDESQFAASLDYAQRDLEEDLRLIELTRQQLGRRLKSLSDADLNRKGVHNERGLVTLGEMLEIEIDHIAHHLRFVADKRKALGLPA